jgi:pimeloyl-ACP methyl ester carboxylesterase
MRVLHTGCRLALLVCLVTAPVSGAGGHTRVTPRNIAFVANGIGDNQTLSMSMLRAVERSRWPVQVHEVHWCSANLLSDIRDQRNHKEHGGKLAARIWSIRQRDPHARICLVGYSGGTAVVLAAAERLPPGGVDRVILLGSGLSGNYDLRPALACAREGIDSFWSTHDSLLELAGDVIGTPDGGKVVPAGRVGFARRITCEADARLYRKLRQHRWHEGMERCDHYGGHFDYTKAAFLEEYVLPLICPSDR